MKKLILVLLVPSTALLLGAGGTVQSKSNAGKSQTTSTRSGSVGDPVGLADGAVYDSVTDLRVKCPGVDLVFRRSYGSWSQHRGSLGVGWMHSYDWRVETNATEVCVFSAGETDVTDGVHKFAPVPLGGSAFNDEGYELRRTDGGLFSVATPLGLTYHFDGQNRLGRIAAWSGESVALTRDVESGSVVEAAHSDGKSLRFALDEDGSIVMASSPDLPVRVVYVYSTNAVEKAVGTKLLVGVVRQDGVRASRYAYEYEAVKRSGGVVFLPADSSPFGRIQKVACSSSGMVSSGGDVVGGRGPGVARDLDAVLQPVVGEPLPVPAVPRPC